MIMELEKSPIEIEIKSSEITYNTKLQNASGGRLSFNFSTWRPMIELYSYRHISSTKIDEAQSNEAKFVHEMTHAYQFLNLWFSLTGLDRKTLIMGRVVEINNESNLYFMECQAYENQMKYQKLTNEIKNGKLIDDVPKYVEETLEIAKPSKFIEPADISKQSTNIGIINYDSMLKYGGEKNSQINWGLTFLFHRSVNVTFFKNAAKAIPKSAPKSAPSSTRF